MHLTAQHEFSATVDEVYAMSIDPAFLEQACRDLGATSQHVEVTPTDQGALAQVSAEVPTDPAFAKLAGPTMTVGQELTWDAPSPDGARTGRLLIKVAGLPVVVDATARLESGAAGTTVTYDGDFSVNVPFLGPVIEKQALPFVTDTLDVQQRTGNAWLATH